MIPSENAHLRHSASSHGGTAGKANQDRYWVSAYTVGTRQVGSVLAVLTDGIGGRRAGDVAAQEALDTVVRAVEQSYASQPLGILQAALIQASQVVLARAEETPEHKGMGSTCLVAWVLGDRLYTTNVGNSRLYLLRQGRLVALNVPHEFIREEPAEGERQKKARPGSEVGQLRTFLGSHLPVEPDFRLPTRPGDLSANSARNQGFRLRPNDRLLLCTDGLSDVLSRDEITELLGSSEAEEAADVLVNAVLEKGGSDNVTAIVLAVPPARPTSALERRRALRSWMFALVATVLLASALYYTWQNLSTVIEVAGEVTPTSLPTHTPEPTTTPLPTITPVE